jgi:hypothetical protein
VVKLLPLKTKIKIKNALGLIFNLKYIIWLT